jgi:release factor glutamine methyltransferase
MRVALAFIRKELAGIYSPEETDSLIFLIFEKMKGYSRTRFLLAKDETLEKDETEQFLKIVDRLKKHEPIQYILGQTEFYGLPFYTPPGVLIPRGETEELVQWIIQENKFKEPTILDIGTGTGCIAISLRKNIPDSMVWACDISPVCIETARKNAELNRAEVAILEYNILNRTPEINFSELDVIVSNPPYVREFEKKQMEKNVLEYEPELALFVPNDSPLIFYERIADFALVHLKNSGKLYFEINEAFGNEYVEMLRLKGFSDIVLKKDLHGKDRMIGCSFFKE